VRVVNKKTIAIFITAILLITSIVLFVTFSKAPPTAPPVSVTQKKGLVFIENMLPLDISQYNITLNQSRTEGYAIEIEQYTLESDENALDVICTIENNVLWSCSVYVRNGSVISDRPYASINDAVTSFLMKYQNYTHIDSTEMIDMLSNVDPTKNATITSGALKLTVTHKDLSGTWFGDSIDFHWVQTFNGCDYLAVDLVFRDGVFSSLIDHRQLYSIGNTAVNISKEQAVKIAMEYIENYSYKIAEDVWISDFNVTGTSAGLFSTVREPYVLYPYWQVKLFLDKTYPGSVDGLLVFIWADSGEAFDCSHFRYRWPPVY
jgi:hypothetical protein